MLGNWFKKNPKRVYPEPGRRPSSPEAKATTIKRSTPPFSGAILKDARLQLAAIMEVPKDERAFITDEITTALREGGNARRACWALEEIGIDRKRSAEISSGIITRANALKNLEKQKATGVLEAAWAHSGGKCFVRFPDDKEGEAKNALHQAANGKRFNITKGLLIDGKWTLPGVEWGCKCTSRTILKGFND